MSTYEEQVLDDELHRWLQDEERAPPRHLREPRERDTEEYTRERERQHRAERRDARTRGRPYRVPDARGVRGRQFADVPDLDEQLVLLREGKANVLAPYYSDRSSDGLSRARGAEDGAHEKMTTSWTDNVRFDVEIASAGAPISIEDAPASRYVTPADDFMTPTFGADGRPDAGGEYAVFSYTPLADEFVRSTPSQRIEVHMRVSFTNEDGVTRVTRNLNPLRTGLFVDMAHVHAVLETNTDNGQPVSTEDGLVVWKSGEQDVFAPTATVYKKPSLRARFRLNPDTNSWLLTRLDWRIRRNQMHNQVPGQELLYFDPQWRVDGEALDQRLVSVRLVEDPQSNALDADVYLLLMPLQSDTSTSGLSVLAGQSHELSLRVTNRLVTGRVVNELGQRKHTVYVALPSLDVRIDDAADILRQSPRELVTFRYRVPQSAKGERARFSSSENTLHNAPVSLIVAPGIEGDAPLQIMVAQIGPIRMSALYEAIADARAAI